MGGAPPTSPLFSGRPGVTLEIPRIINSAEANTTNMRKIVANTFVSLDGVMQAPGGPEEDPTGGFGYGGWSVNYWDEMMGKAMGEAMSRPFDLLLGRRTYEIFAAHWPYVKDGPEAAAAEKLNGARKYVVSNTLSKATWANSTIISGDAAEGIAMLKGGGGPEIQVHGSGNLIQTLLKSGLIDEFRIWTFPITLGLGKRLFAEGTVPAGLRLLDCKASSTGVIIASYAKGGKLKTGSFAP
jgi:dihydrofolate reductase